MTAIRTSAQTATRPPAVAGMFYPADRQQLHDEVNEYLTELGDSVQQAHRRAAWGCVVAGVASLASVVVAWLTPAPARRQDGP